MEAHPLMQQQGQGQGQGSNVNLFSQIEQMMAAARTEAQTLDDMKYKLRETEELRARVPELENQISAAKEMNYGLRRTMGDLERQNAQLRNDMQSLNDMYHSEHSQFVNLQQARGNLEHEVKRLKRELASNRSETGKTSELRSSHDSLISESGNLKKTVESLKTSNTILNAEKEALVEVHKRDKEKWTKQTASMEEEAIRLRGVVEEGAALVEDMKVRMQYVESKSTQVSDRLMMAWEDRAASEQRICTTTMHATLENSILRRDLAMLRTEIQHLQCASVDAETQFIAATSGLKDVIAKHENEMSNVQLKAVEMKEVVNTLKAQNQELDQEVSSLRMKHFSAVVEARTHIAERDQLVLDAARLEAEKVQLEGVVAAVNRTAESQMDELMMHMRNMSAQNEALQSQLNDSQSKYWEEMKTFKDLEASLMSEVALLSKKSHEQTLLLQTLQAEKDTADTASKQEISSLSQQVLQLQQDLDKHTNDIVTLTNEKAALSDERNALTQRIEEIEYTSKTYLNTVKGAFENERAKLEDEVKKRSSKLKSVDAQRQGLLKETHDLGVTLATVQAEADQLRGELAVANEQLQSGRTQTDTLQTRNAELTEELKVESARVTSTKAELTSAQQLAQEKEQQLLAVQSEASKWQQEKAQVQLRIAELTEVNEVLKAQNRESDGDLAGLRSAYDAARNDVLQLSAERDQWNVVMSRLETEKAGLESKLTRDTAALEGQRDDLQTRLQHAHSQCDATLAQLREMQNRHWEEIKAIKDSEATLLSETDSLTQELHEKITLLTSLQSEKAQWEHHSKEEINRMGHMTALMTDELEKRVLELTQITTERNALIDEKQADKKRIEELEASTKTMEDTFKHTLDADRTKLQEELRKRVAKLKTMETEKQELLQETHELSTQLGAAQRDVSSMQTQLIAATEQLKEHTHHEDMLKARNTELLEELKAAARREQDVRLELTRADERLRGEDVRVDNLIKETKKMATQQVMDVTNQLRLAQDENERLKTQCTNLEAAEKRVMSDLDRARKDIELVMTSRDEMQQQNTAETASLRKDLQEQRSKVKQISEAKAVMEVDMVNHRMQLQKYEEELVRSRDRSDALSAKLNATMGELETGKQAAKDEIRASKTKAEEAASKVVYLEDMLGKQRVELERIMHDYSRAERDGFNDNLRLKTQLEAYDQEVSELRPLIPLLRKENGESKARLEKLQASSTATVNGLLEELKAAEGALSSERKKAQTDAEMHRMQLMEMQTAMERAKDNIEESVSRAKNEKADKDKRIQQLENEVERLKVISLAKEGRVDDLEKQHQDDRARLLSLNLKIESAERSASDALAAVEQEKAQVERLEKKLQQQQQGGSGGHVHGSSGGGMGIGIGNRSARASFSSIADDYRDPRDNNSINSDRGDLYSSNSNSSSHRYATQYGSSSTGSGSVTSSGLPTRSLSGSMSGRASTHTLHHTGSSSHSQPPSQHHQPSPSSSSQHYRDNDNDNDSAGSALQPVPILPLHDHIPQGPGPAPGGYSLEHASSSSSSHLRHQHLPPSPEGHSATSSSSSSMYMNDDTHNHHHQPPPQGFGAYAAAAATMSSSYASLSPPRGKHRWDDSKDDSDIHQQGQGPHGYGQSTATHFQSPVIDRVAQALAARAAKDRDREPAASSGGYGYGSNQNSSRRASDSARRSFHEQDEAGAVYSNGSVGPGAGASHRPEVTEEYDGGSDGNGASNQAVEHSIQRTESFIKNRLRAAGAGAAASAHTDPNTSSRNSHSSHGTSSPVVTSSVSVPAPQPSASSSSMMDMSHHRGGGGPRVTGYGDRDDEDDDDGRSMEGYGYGNNNHNHQATSRHAPYGPYSGPSSSSSSYKEDDNYSATAATGTALSLKRSNSGSKPGSSSSGSSKSLSVSLRHGSSPAADDERENCAPNDGTRLGPNGSTGGVTRDNKRGLSAQSAALPKINKNSGAAPAPAAMNAFGGNGSARR